MPWFLIYALLGLVQLAAYFEGIELWLGFGLLLGLVSFIVLGAIPLGSIITAGVAFYGAFYGWRWYWWEAALLCFPFPLFAIAMLTIQGSANMIGRLRR
ncbi:hypothetical protein ACVIGB_000327 [Bradyrhizobium sp. USDA 4341]